MTPQTIMYKLRGSRHGRIILHVVLWLVYFLAIYYLESISFNSYKDVAAIAEALKNVFATMLFYYPLVYLVWPFFINKKKYVLSALLIIVLIVVYATVDFLLEQAILESCPNCMERLRTGNNGAYELMQRGALNVILVRLISLGIIYQLFVFLAFPLTIKAMIEYFNQHVKTIRLQQENIQLEFNFLKSQVNPHFLFNTLNNIYALILKDEKEASAETVAKLASFMRYSLYESNTHHNNIIKEIDLLKVYLELERIRLNDIVVNFVSRIDYDHYNLPPLLFMPAVENAFKYCTRNADGDAYIFMKLSVEAGRLAFTISNTFDGRPGEPKLHGGIGLQNLQKRLEHYYPGGDTSLQVRRDQGVFQIIIHLNLV